ncbi:glycosyltransferase family 2 protein [Empedobacter falsenii]
MSILAIVIPYYKLTFFEETLESLFLQTNQDFTLYIGNDKSPEDPQVLIDKYKSIITKYIKFDSNLGGTYLTKQWDRCIDLIQDEEWIMLLGDDDKISVNLVDEFHKNISEVSSKKIDVVRSNVIEIDGNGNILRECFFPKLEKSTDSYIRKITQNYHISLPEYIFNIKSYKKYGFKHFPYAFGSDNIAWLEFTKGKDIYTLSNAVCYMRLSEINISGNNSNIKEKVFSKYLTQKFILDNLIEIFNKEQKLVIIKTGYKYLLFSDHKNYKERLNYFFKTFKYLNLNYIINTFLK